MRRFIFAKVPAAMGVFSIMLRDGEGKVVDRFPVGNISWVTMADHQTLIQRGLVFMYAKHLLHAVTCMWPEGH